jgi:hypothetical protein
MMRQRAAMRLRWPAACRAVAWVDGAAQDRANPRAGHYNLSTTVYNRKQNRREQFGTPRNAKTLGNPGVFGYPKYPQSDLSTS